MGLGLKITILTMMPWFAANITRAFPFESIRVSNFGFVIRVLRLMVVPFRVGLHHICLGGHLLCFGCFLLFVICVFNDDMSDYNRQKQLLLMF